MTTLQSVTLHKGDLPEGLSFGAIVAVDTEAMGLNPVRDRLCVVQLSAGDGHVHLVQIIPGHDAPHLRALMADRNVLKLLHFARFDMGMIAKHLGVMMAPVYCTKIASRLTRTYTDKHGLKDLVKEVLGIDMSKEQQSSDWGAAELSPEQQRYAASDVLHLHRLKEKLDERLSREKRQNIAAACFNFLPVRATLDLSGWPDEDIFAH